MLLKLKSALQNGGVVVVAVMMTEWSLSPSRMVLRTDVLLSISSKPCFFSRITTIAAMATIPTAAPMHKTTKAVAPETPSEDGVLTCWSAPLLVYMTNVGVVCTSSFSFETGLGVTVCSSRIALTAPTNRRALAERDEARARC